MKKKVAIIIPNLKKGGAEKVAANLTLFLPKELYEIYLILYETDIIDFEYNAKIISLNSPSSKHFIKKIISIFVRYFKIRRIKKNHKFNTVISILRNSNFMNIITRQDENIIISIHNYMSRKVHGFYGKIYKYIVKFLYNRSDKIVIVSDQIKDDLIMNFNIDQDKIKLIYNFIDVNGIRDKMKEKVEDKYLHWFDNSTIVNVGRFDPQKGQDHIIRVFPKVLKHIPNLKLVLIGTGDYEHQLREMAEKLNISDKILFLGFRNNPYKYMYNSSAFVLSSLYEGFGLVLVEALACKLLVISTNCKSGPSEILQLINSKTLKSNCGILTPPFKDKEYDFDINNYSQEDINLEQILIDVLNNKVNYLNEFKNNTEIRLQDFKPELIIKEWINIL